MEEDAGIKGTVTRLRRRLSVEKPEDVASPSTPTKKRGGRLAAKPQLDLIVENAQISSPRKTRRKSVADAEEKPLTPSRRSTRIKSNTSIISETISLTTESPRARRALRRNSQAGSDTEGPVTPARQTRKTRRDSASSIENQEPAASRPLQVVEMVIAEEPESDVHKSVNEPKTSPKIVAEELSPNSARKSKRLLEKRNRRSGSFKSDHDLSTASVENISLNISLKDKTPKTKTGDHLNKSGEPQEFCEKLSESNANLLEKLITDRKLKASNHNKSVPSLENKKTKRNRTESWPMVLASPAKDNIVFSDNEQSKKKSANNDSWIYNSESDPNKRIEGDKNTTVQNSQDDLQRLIESQSKRKKRKSETSFSKDAQIPPEAVQSNEAIASNVETSTSIENVNQKSIMKDVKDSYSNTENTIVKSDNIDTSHDIPKSFDKNVLAIVYLEDSDSNSLNMEKTIKTQQQDSGDQCVPVVSHDIKFQEKNCPLGTNLISNEQKIILQNQPIIEKQSCNGISDLIQANNINDSCEPMDIDETIHEEILQKSQNSLQASIVERKSLSQRTSITDEPEKSKRKSSISASDISKCENKSTLILSQIKDVSKTSDNVLKSPKAQTSEALSKSITNIQDNRNKVAKSNLSVNDLKSTPLKPINVQKLTMQTSTPIATQQIDKSIKSEEKSSSPKKSISNSSKSMNEALSSEEDSDETSGPRSNFMDDEAEEASDDYESGDSRDEKERQYEDEHEIIERGETLGSEEDITNDSDYEKDSFVVSSDADDDDLLSGSGDDLAMSDKELNMSKKSKNKYNERKLKEQKNASREMFESRHKLNTSEKESSAPKTKKNRMRLNSTLSESDEEIVVKVKKNKRLRLDSTFDTSDKQNDANNSLNKSNKKSNESIQKSICDQTAVNENEITIGNESVVDTIDPLQIKFKQEPKSPHTDINISVVQLTSRADIENVDVDEGKSMLNQTETDPLQATMACEDTSDSSENEEIMQNYDSILKELNKNKSKKLTSDNLSLNIDKKAKKNKSEPILDQLNLTNPKTPKKNLITPSQDVVDSKISESTKEKQDSDSLLEGSSSSIDLNLLFSEDNYESSDENINMKKSESIAEENEKFVPLRKSTGKTNIEESVGDLFFIDTTGAQNNEKEDDDKADEAPLEVFFTSDNKKKKKNKLETSQNNVESNGEVTLTNEESFVSSSKKRKRKSSDFGTAHDSVLEGVQEIVDTEAPNESLSAGRHKKKRKISHQDDTIEQHDLEVENEADVEKKVKKKKKKSREVSLETTTPEKVENEVDEKQTKKKKKHRDGSLPNTTPETETTQTQIKKNKKRKGSSSSIDLQLSLSEGNGQSGFIDKKDEGGNAETHIQENVGDECTNVKDEGSLLKPKKRKRKSSDSGKAQDIVNEAGNEVSDEKQVKKKKTKIRDVNFQNTAPESETTQTQIKKNKKRKERDEDNDRKHTKVSKENSFHEVHMPLLPASILSQLDDKPRKNPEAPKVISTSKFVVENARQKRAKPSKFLEESIYLDANSPFAKRDKTRIKNPKVLPFIPTASISESGFTTNFQIKKVSESVQFLAEPTGIAFSKEKYLQKKEIKRLGTYDLYKKQMKRKLSKF